MALKVGKFLISTHKAYEVVMSLSLLILDLAEYQILVQALMKLVSSRM